MRKLTASLIFLIIRKYLPFWRCLEVLENKVHWLYLLLLMFLTYASQGNFGCQELALIEFLLFICIFLCSITADRVTQTVTFIDIVVFVFNIRYRGREKVAATPVWSVRERIFRVYLLLTNFYYCLISLIFVGIGNFLFQRVRISLLFSIIILFRQYWRC